MKVFSLLSPLIETRNIRSSLWIVAALAVSSLLSSCESTSSREEIPNFRQGVIVVAQQTEIAFNNINAKYRSQQIDRTLNLPTLSEDNFKSPLQNEDIARWSRAFSVVESYAALLEALLSPEHRTGIEADVASLSEAIGALRNNDLPSGVSAGFESLAGLLLEIKNEREAITAIRMADPAIQQIFSSMKDAIGKAPNTGLRADIQASWRTDLAALRAEYLRSSNEIEKRSVIDSFLATIGERDAQDLSLASLRRSIDLLSVAHTELARGDLRGTTGALSLIEREYKSWAARRSAAESPN